MGPKFGDTKILQRESHLGWQFPFYKCQVLFNVLEEGEYGHINSTEAFSKIIHDVLKSDSAQRPYSSAVNLPRLGLSECSLNDLFNTLESRTLQK